MISFSRDKFVRVVKIPRINMHMSDREEPLVKYEPVLRRKDSNLASLMNLVMLLAGVYVALFVGSFAKYVVLLIIASIYFFARIE